MSEYTFLETSEKSSEKASEKASEKVSEKVYKKTKIPVLSSNIFVFYRRLFKNVERVEDIIGKPMPISQYSDTNFTPEYHPTIGIQKHTLLSWCSSNNSVNMDQLYEQPRSYKGFGKCQYQVGYFDTTDEQIALTLKSPQFKIVHIPGKERYCYIYSDGNGNGNRFAVFKTRVESTDILIGIKTLMNSYYMEAELRSQLFDYLNENLNY